MGKSLIDHIIIYGLTGNEKSRSMIKLFTECSCRSNYIIKIIIAWFSFRTKKSGNKKKNGIIVLIRESIDANTHLFTSLVTY